MNENRREQGQVLVLIILAIVAIMGFVALAVDGGRIYTERRRAQAAADAAAYAAAFSASMGLDWQNKAMEQIKLNGYDDSIITDTGLPIDVMIYNPPLDGATHPERYENIPDEFFQVIIRTTVNPVFSQFVYTGGISMTVEAVARATNYRSVFPGRALVTTGPNTCDAMKFHGNQTLYLNGGDIYAHSNRCNGGVYQEGVNDTGGSACNAIRQDGGNSVTIVGGGIFTPGCIRGSSSGTMTQDTGIYKGVPQVSIPILPSPECNGLPTRSYSEGVSSDDPKTVVLQPGYYPGGIKVTGKRTDVTLESGMYCLGSDLSMNGGRVTGDGVFIVMKGGGIDIGGNVIVHLTAAERLFDPAKQNWGGMLFYMVYNNTSVISLNGGGNSHYTGTVYAPGPASPESKSKCKITGNSATLAYNCQFICYSMDVGGTADLNIYYREKQNYQMPPSLELTK